MHGGFRLLVHNLLLFGCDIYIFFVGCIYVIYKNLIMNSWIEWLTLNAYPNIDVQKLQYIFQ